jgi:D-aminoacyl-tRNA deacylase
METEKQIKLPVVVSSVEDIASTSIKEKLLGLATWSPHEPCDGPLEISFSEEHQAYLVTIQEGLVNSDRLDEYCARSGIDPLCYIYASRHRSATGQPALLCHVTGNWGDEADLGGSPREVCRSSGALLRTAYLLLLDQKQQNPAELEKFTLNMEVTHHGPTNLESPLVFVELGSSEENWRDPAGSLAVATVIMELLAKIRDANFDLGLLASDLGGVGIGFGGPHYAATFDRVMATSRVAFSHVIPKHQIDASLTKEVIERAIASTVEGVSWFVLDWKGLNADNKDVLMPILAQFSIPVKRTKELEKEFPVDFSA